MRRDALRLSRRHRAWLYSTILALFVTGVLWLVFHHRIRVAGEFGPTPHPLEPWWLKGHGAAAMLFLILLGTLVPLHIRRGWHRKRNRLTGVVFLALNGLLVLSGYALYYFGGETSRDLISRVHWLVGLGLPIALPWHIWQGRSERRQSHGHQ